MDEDHTRLSMIQLKNVVRVAALPAYRQVESFPDGVVVADEIALDFDSHCKWALEGYKAPNLTAEQRSSLISLDALLSRMSDEHNEDLWTEDALRSLPEWDEVRDKAEKILDAFGWSIEE